MKPSFLLPLFGIGCMTALGLGYIWLVDREQKRMMELEEKELN